MTDEAQSPLKLSPLETFIDPEKLHADLAFSEHNLSDAYTQHAALYSHYASLAARATHQVDRAESAVNLCKAKLSIRIRERVQTATGKRPTKDEVEDEVTVDPRYIALQKRYHDARLIAALVKEAASAFRQRRDMLVQLGFDTREEKKGELRMQEITQQENLRNQLKERAMAVINRSSSHAA